jgi:peptide deformylase
MGGWDARIVQHEVDHLNGIMFFDRLSRQMRKRLLQKWEKKKR